MIKFFELRDAETFIPLAAWRPRVSLDSADPVADLYLVRRAGFAIDSPALIVTVLTSLQTHYDPFAWRDQQTMTPVHLYLREHFEALTTGAVIDPRVIRGERDAPPTPERLWRAGMSADD